MKTIEQILNGNAKANSKVTITIREEGSNKAVFEQKVKSFEAVKNVKAFVKRVNALTLPHKGKLMYITINTMEMKFIGGKFAPNFRKLANIFITNELGFIDNPDQASELRDLFYAYISTNVNNILDAVKLISLVQNSTILELANAMSGINTEKLVEATKEKETATA